MKFVTMLDISLNVAASAGMYRKISETHDIFNMSKEMLTVGRYMAAAWGEFHVPNVQGGWYKLVCHTVLICKEYNS